MSERQVWPAVSNTTDEVLADVRVRFPGNGVPLDPSGSIGAHEVRLPWFLITRGKALKIWAENGRVCTDWIDV